MARRVCIRGCGKVGERCFRLLQYKEDMDICFSDMDGSKRVCCGKNVYSVNESIGKYHEGFIDFFIVPLKYAKKIQKDIIKELLLKGVKEEHILLFPNRVEEEYDIDNLADIKFIRKFCFSDLDMENLHNYGDEKKIYDFCSRLKEIYDREQYQLEFTGGGI